MDNLNTLERFAKKIQLVHKDIPRGYRGMPKGTTLKEYSELLVSESSFLSGYSSSYVKRVLPLVMVGSDRLKPLISQEKYESILKYHKKEVKNNPFFTLTKEQHRNKNLESTLALGQTPWSIQEHNDLKRILVQYDELGIRINNKLIAMELEASSYLTLDDRPLRSANSIRQYKNFNLRTSKLKQKLDWECDVKFNGDVISLKQCLVECLDMERFKRERKGIVKPVFSKLSKKLSQKIPGCPVSVSAITHFYNSYLKDNFNLKFNS